jgi:L-arabinonolactonase
VLTVSNNNCNKIIYGPFELIYTVPCANILGEGVQWNHTDNCVWWTDIKSNKIFRFHPATETLTDWSTPEPVGCFAFVDGDQRLLLAMASGFAWFEKDSSAIEWIARPEQHWVGNRLNDGRVDRQGRFWAGSVVENKQTANQSASLFCLDASQRVTTHLSGLRISNSLCFSLDSQTLYHADSPSRQIKAYDFDARSGQITNGVVFAETGMGIDPDGSCIDAEGCLWNAEWGGGRVTRYSPEGAVSYVLEIPVSQPTCVAFGGPDLRWLCVTSARLGLSQEALSRQPEAGNLFIYRTNFKGVFENHYKPA